MFCVIKKSSLLITNDDFQIQFKYLFQKNLLCQLSLAGTSQNCSHSPSVFTKLLKTIVLADTAFSLANFLKSSSGLNVTCSPILKVTFILSNKSTSYFCSKFCINCTEASIEQPVAVCTSWFTAIIIKRLYRVVEHHIGNNGDDTHSPATDDNSGFMTPEHIKLLRDSKCKRTRIPDGSDVLTLDYGSYEGFALINLPFGYTGRAQVDVVHGYDEYIKQIYCYFSYSGTLYYYNLHTTWIS